MPAASASAISQLLPWVLPGQRYGSFSGKVTGTISTRYTLKGADDTRLDLEGTDNGRMTLYSADDTRLNLEGV
jgi:hypothetical protein